MMRYSPEGLQAFVEATALGSFSAAARKLGKRQSAQIDELMGRMEQALTDPDGLPGREWFKHMIYAPGLLTGYGVKTVPGVREALEARNWQQADQYAAITARVLDGYRTELDKLTHLLQANAR